MSTSMKSPGEVVAFYSYKGGTGRTMSLVNLAWLLADKLPFGEKILLVDWDLEAPGLHRYFHETLRPLKPGADVSGNEHSADDSPGIIDLFATLLDHAQETTIRRKRNPEIKARALLDRIDLTDYIMKTAVPNLHVIKARRFDNDYADRINGFDWSAFYDAQPLVFREFAERLKRDYRYVFIDSRTGQTDTAGICTALLPEKLVAVFTPNRQSLLGLETVLKQAIDYRKAADDARPLVVYPLPSRVEINQDALRRTWRFGDPARRIEGYEPFFSRLFSKNYGLKYCHLKKYFDEVQIKQSSIYAFGEEIAVHEERSQKVEDSYSLTQAYQGLLNWLQSGYLPWEHPEVIRLLKSIELRASTAAAEPAGLAELVSAANELMDTLITDANYGNAYILGRHTLRHVRKVLGDEHPATLSAMNKLATTLNAQGDLVGARVLQEQTLTIYRRALGDEHADTLSAMNDLARMLCSQGNLLGAQAHQEQVLNVCSRLFGEEHLDTLIAMNNLADTLFAQGNRAGARALQERALAVCRRVLGDEHPYTLTAMSNLTGTLSDHLIKDTATITFYVWLDEGAELPGGNILTGNPFGATLPEDQSTTVQNYFAEYHLEYFRQRFYNGFPSRLHSQLLFATKVDAEAFGRKHPARIFGKQLTRVRSQGAYICSFHDSSWLDYLRLPHAISMATLDEVVNHYWKGTLTEEAGLTFLNERWRDPPVIEALFQGSLEPVPRSSHNTWLPDFEKGASH